eukprot:353939-Chlamydomonas_euryale.AAC.29
MKTWSVRSAWLNSLMKLHLGTSSLSVFCVSFTVSSSATATGGASSSASFSVEKGASDFTSSGSGGVGMVPVAVAAAAWRRTPVAWCAAPSALTDVRRPRIATLRAAEASVVRAASARGRGRQECPIRGRCPQHELETPFTCPLIPSRPACRSPQPRTRRHGYSTHRRTTKIAAAGLLHRAAAAVELRKSLVGTPFVRVRAPRPRSVATPASTGQGLPTRRVT